MELQTGLMAAALGPLLSLATFAAQPLGGFSGEIELILWKSLFQTPAPTGGRCNLLLQLEARGGEWDRVTAHGQNYSNGLHLGLVEQAQVTDQDVRLLISAVINGDQWTRGTWHGAFAVDLKRDASGKLDGTYTGTFKGHPITGRATGQIRAPRPVAQGFRSVEPGEHPRVLFRRDQIPALKQKLQTPLGRAYQAQASDPVNLGVLYALTGEKRYADQAQAIVRGYLANADNEYLTEKGAGSGGFGHTLAASALALDLCYDAWPVNFRAQLEGTLLEILPRLMRYCFVTSHANTHPCSNYFGPGHGSPAVASLVLVGDKGPDLEKPEDPVKTATIVMPPDDFEPGEGVNVLDLAPGAVPAQWLYAGPVGRRCKNDVLGGIGGYGRARPKLGTEFRTGVMVDDKVEMMSLTFRKLPDDMMKDGAIDLARLAPGGGPSTTVFYTVLRAAQKQIVAPARNSADTRIWLNDTELTSGTYYSLRPGLYPVLVVHSTDKSAGVLNPRLEPPGSDFGSEGIQKHKLELALWDHYKAQCDKAGGISALKIQIQELGHLRMFQHYRLGMGDGGFQAETGSYAMIASWYPLVYAACYPNVFGRNASPHPDVTHLMVRRMMQVLFREDGSTAVQKLNSVVGFDTGWVAAAFGIIPEKYKPGVLWGWNKVRGVTSEASIPNIVGGDRGLNGIARALAFLNYPLHMKPQHPSKSMPLAWEAPTFGHYTFRSGWEGKDEFIAQTFLKAAPVCGWNHANAGTFRVWGLGHGWNSSGEERAGARELESVVLLPKDDHAQSSCARLAYLKTDDDGSGVLTMNMDDVYAPSAGKRGLWDKNLLRSMDEDTPQPITGLRALAWDYSQKSGAPAMMVMVDSIRGGSEKLWTWQMPGAGKGGKSDGPPRATVDGNTFTLAHSDASMKATFVSPGRVNISAGVDQVEGPDARHGYVGPVNRVKASGADPTAGGFLVIITFQRGAPPPVKVEGEGLGAIVTVGQRTVRFDGQKIILGP
jgi:hypothetical protein